MAIYFRSGDRSEKQISFKSHIWLGKSTFSNMDYFWSSEFCFNSFPAMSIFTLWLITELSFSFPQLPWEFTILVYGLFIYYKGKTMVKYSVQMLLLKIHRYSSLTASINFLIIHRIVLCGTHTFYLYLWDKNIACGKYQINIANQAFSLD